MNGLDFIEDSTLRKTLEDSIEYTYALYEQTKAEGQNELYREETYRVIVLYVVAAIEAVLLYAFKTRGDTLECVEYKHVHTLPAHYIHREKEKSNVVIAVQTRSEKKDYQLGVHELVTHFHEKKLMKEATKNAILNMNDVRNTFHFSKEREQTCDIARVEAALSLLVYVITRAPTVTSKAKMK